MSEKLTITAIHRSKTKKDGTPLVTKDGRPYERVGIKTTERGDAWLSGFSNFTTDKWKDGDVVEVEVTQSGDFLNFKAMSTTMLLEKRVAALEYKVASLLGGEKTDNTKVAGTDVAYPTESIDPADIPF